ncbi:hypothetical protein [Roseimaritima ulvae]|uniref:Cobalt transporter subunit (CbtA) n=1 Tax=Roseimaritima ulvae TaxID=980254 RepID=A0A5B9QJT0_9BACT|nr:hypothetical protein [Roseimaritima ulvae]QEG38229.1 hypothetical protein UC8_01840 [Roseimaritima ulvae]
MPESETTPSTTSSSFHRTWIAGALLASLAAWGLLNFTPIQRTLPPELRAVDMYSPPEIQTQYEELVPWVTWENCLLRFAFAGLGLGLVSSLVVAFGGSHRRGLLIAAGTVAGLLFGTLAGQVGYSLRAWLNTPSMIAQIEEPLFRDTLLFVIVSLVLSGALWVVYGLGRRELMGQQAFSVLMAGGLSGLLLPITASLFPGMLTHVFPTEGLGLPAVWFGMLGVLAAFLPLATGPRGSAAADKTHDTASTANAVDTAKTANAPTDSEA